MSLRPYGTYHPAGPTMAGGLHLGPLLVADGRVLPYNWGMDGKKTEKTTRKYLECMR